MNLRSRNLNIRHDYFKKSNLIACYSVYNGTELLEDSINELRKSKAVKKFIICYQTTSNTGNKKPDLEKWLKDTFSDNKDVFLYNWEPDLKINTKKNEMNKHNFMLDKARLLDATHVLFSACDHFYKPDEFFYAAKYAINLDFDATYTRMYTYYKHKSWRLTPMEDYYMPFIIKLTPEMLFISSQSTVPLRVDPALKLFPVTKWKLFTANECVLHHYSMVRVDIREKFKNAAASIRWKESDIKAFIDEYENYNLKENPGVKYFGGRKIEVV
jgi:hypothetical protein